MTEATLPTTTETPMAPAPAAMPQLVAPAVEWNDGVKSAADYYGLTDYLPAAIHILQELCPPGTEVSMQVSREPETAERRVVVVAQMPSSTTAERSHECFEAVIDRRIAELPHGINDPPIVRHWNERVVGNFQINELGNGGNARGC